MRISLYIVLFFAFQNQVIAQSDVDFSYAIKLVNDGEVKGCEVTLRYQTNSTCSSTFSLPQIWGVNSGLDFIELKSVKGAKQIKQSDEQSLKFKHKKNAIIELKYFVQSLVKDTVYHHREEFLPNVQKDYFILFTNSIFITLNDSSRQSYSFEINWLNYPENYTKLPLTSFGDGLTQTLKNHSIADFQNGILIGGDYKMESFNDPIKKSTIRFIYRSAWQFKPNEMANLVFSTFKTQQKFWNDYSTNVYNVFMSPAFTENEYDMSYNGTGLYNSFNVIATNNGNTNPQNMVYLFNHELMHHWIGNTILNGVDEELSYWFSEGFTDYFTYYNMRESQLISDEVFYEKMGSIFTYHYGNDLCNAVNDSIKPNFWKRGYYGKLPYNRGNIFAYYLDHLLRSKTNGTIGLIQVMQKMMQEALVEKRHFDKIWFNETIKELVGFEVNELIEKYIFEGEVISVETLNEVLDRKVQLQPTKVFALGYETVKTDEGKVIVTRIIPNSGAAIAGIKEGQTIAGYSIYGSPSTLSEVTVLTEKGEETISFYPYVLKVLPQHVKQ